MILLLVQLAAAASCDPQAALASLRVYDDGAREAYHCLADHADGASILTTSLDAEPPQEDAALAGQSGRPSADVGQLGRPSADVGQLGRPSAVHARTTRCLALWLLEHADAAWDPALVRRLSADDRRLLADGVFARHGRASPSPEHARVFQEFAWYKPDPRYTDNRLGATDRSNIALADQPPPAPVAPAPPVAEEAPAVEQGCGCAGAPGAPTAVGVGLLLGVAGMRRWTRMQNSFPLRVTLLRRSRHL